MARTRETTATTAARRSATSPPQVRPQSLYFAYGSNLSLSQMAKRCPNSRYIGRGRLPDFRWQINQRGYANIVLSPGDHVEGLCYLLSPNDEVRLDKNEGVPTAYEKITLKAELSPASAALVGRKVVEILDFDLASSESQVSFQSRTAQDGGGVPVASALDAVRSCISYFRNQRSIVAGDRRRSFGDQQHEREGESVQMLFYISLQHTTDDVPREEYVERMVQGVQDAMQLGMAETYIERKILPWLQRE